MDKFLRRLKYLSISIERWLHKKLKFIVLPGFDGVPLFDVLVFFIRGIFKGVITYRAAAIAFNFFLALVPFVLFLFTLIPFVTTDDYQTDLLELLNQIIPASVYSMAETTIEETIRRGSSGLLSVVFIMSVYFAANGVDALIEGFGQSIHEVELWPWWKQKLTALAMMTSLSFLMIMAMAFLGFGKLAITILMQQGIVTSSFTVFWLTGFRWLIIIIFVLLSISMVYYFGQPKDREQNNYQFFSPGSILATTLFITGAVFLKMYFENFSRYNIIYGSIGSIILLMVWLYYNAIILLVGFELNASIRQTKSVKGKYTIVD